MQGKLSKIKKNYDVTVSGFKAAFDPNSEHCEFRKGFECGHKTTVTNYRQKYTVVPTKCCIEICPLSDKVNDDGDSDRNVPYIYESPDKGKTVFRRRFGDHTTREQVPTKEDEKWERIQEHCRKFSAEMLEWTKEQHKLWGPPWSKDQTPEYDLHRFWGYNSVVE